MELIKDTFKDTMELIENLGSLNEYNQVMEYLEARELIRNTAGTVNVKDLFDDNNSFVCYDFLDFKAVKKWIKDNEPYKYDSGYTYNYNGRIANDVHYYVIQGLDSVLVAINIHVGRADARWGFSDTFCMVFDHYDSWLEFLNDRRILADIEYLFNGETNFISFDGTAIMEEVSVYDHLTDEDYLYYDAIDEDDLKAWFDDQLPEYELITINCY